MKTKIKSGRTTITTDVAYIAGFLDGEGCIRIKHASQKGNSFYVWLAITNSYKPTLDYIASIFGGKVRFAYCGTNKKIYHFLISSSEAVDMLKVVIGFLREKKPQALLAIDFHEKKHLLSLDQKRKYVSKITSLKK